jgi:pimeloyl-ACP methyl ester carboxylesterase
MHLEQTTVAARGLTFPMLSCGTGELVLCLHGFPDNLATFAPQLPAFARRGYRAVSVALRGYAPSCLPPLEDCHPLEVARDAVAIVQALGESRAHLVGHDWGAVAAYLACALAPDRWLSVSTLAVPHPLGLMRALPRVPRQLRLSWYMLFFQLPVAEHVLRARDFALLERLWRAWSPDFAPPVDEMQAVKRTFTAPGVCEAALAYYRNMFELGSGSAREARELLVRYCSQVPTLALTGADDGCIDTRTYEHAMSSRYFADLHVERVAGAGHFLHREAPETVNELLLGFFARHAASEPHI